MAGLCEGGNEPPGSLKAKRSPTSEARKRHVLTRRFVSAVVETRSTIKDIKVDKLSVVSQMLQYLTRTVQFLDTVA
ncbi:hypothetical protein ANN_02323 [Periplaneta americana]|uniref:BHLH domain-containing protein n=1 Tax=Periplaneta americana TaxID=6978 RepID=A0ABQ8TZ25_PERAM|nr:hypothetical protein ANN_02323 [Periplaneta americana]